MEDLMQNVYPIKTTFEKLDEITGGFFTGELTIIGSRPAVGYEPLLC